MSNITYVFDGSGSGPGDVSYGNAWTLINGQWYFTQYIEVFIMWGNYIGPSPAPGFAPHIPTNVEMVTATLNLSPSWSNGNPGTPESVMNFLGTEDVYSFADPAIYLGVKFLFSSRILNGGGTTTEDPNPYVCAWSYPGITVNAGNNFYVLPPLGGFTNTFGPDS